MKIKIFFAWYDFWIGVYINKEAMEVYICIIPCIVIKIWLKSMDFELAKK